MVSSDNELLLFLLALSRAQQSKIEPDGESCSTPITTSAYTIAGFAAFYTIAGSLGELLAI